MPMPDELWTLPIQIPDELLIQDVRCFRGEQRARLRPITLLVGENSTGKTTFLGCYSALHREQPWRHRHEEYPPDFGHELFSMGSFRDIVRFRRGSPGRIPEFRLGFGTPGAGSVPAYKVAATFGEGGSQPVIRSWRYEFESGSFLEFRRNENGGTVVATEHHQVAVEKSFHRSMFNVIEWSGPGLFEPDPPGIQKIKASVAQQLNAGEQGEHRIRRVFTRTMPRLVPVAPLRAKPRRTYDPIPETPTPEGAHIPMLLMRLDHSDKERWQTLREDLVEFGRASGMFSDIRVKRHGKQISDPFQLQFKANSASYANIMDVGYGVSQSLPVLVELLTAELRALDWDDDEENIFLFLLQQPEVHLHPRGQAELASFLVNSVRKRRHRFLVETHSDHIIDRVRIAVRKKLLPAEDVSLLYFEPQRNSVKIHNLYLDEYGNIENAPPGYRDFFLRETDTLLGLDD